MKLRWFIIGLCAINGGCELFQVGERDLTCETCLKTDTMVDRGKYRRTAAAAWRSHQAANPDAVSSIDLAEGFMDGYAAFLETVNGVPPEVPSEHYWKPRYQSLEGRRAIADWFEGYRLGTLQAQAGGVSGVVARAPAPVATPGSVPPSGAPRPQVSDKAAPPSSDPEAKPAELERSKLTLKPDPTAAPEPTRSEKVELSAAPSSSGPAPAPLIEQKLVPDATPPGPSLSEPKSEAKPGTAPPEQLPPLPNSTEPQTNLVMPSEPQPKEMLPAAGTLLFPPEDDQRPRRGGN